MNHQFQGSSGLIRVHVDIEGPLGLTSVVLALDTGALGTLIGIDPLRLIGYDPLPTGKPLTLVTGSGIVPAIRFPITSLTALGSSRTNFPIVAHNLPAKSSVDGVLGLDFFRDHILTLDFPKGEITLNPGQTP